MSSNDNPVNNYYQGIFLTETILGNPNGDFVDNSPRNFDGVVFTTDKCIKYNIRKYIHDTLEDLDNNNNIVFFYPRLSDDVDLADLKFKTRKQVFKDIFNDEFDSLLKGSIDVRMFGGTFSIKNNSKQIYGPIQISYGLDINKARIIRVQIGSPFSAEKNKQKTTGSEYVVDDAIISYDITVNPNNFPGLLLEEDLNIFKKSLWCGTNSRKSSSKKTDSKFLMLIKFINNSDKNNVSAINIGELNRLVSIENMEKRKLDNGKIELNCSSLFKKLNKYLDYIDSIEFIYDSDEIEINNLSELKLDDKKIEKLEPHIIFK